MGGGARGLFVCGSRMHAGKSTTSMALMRLLSERFARPAFMKPVGQSTVEHAGAIVDKDVALLRECFPVLARHDPRDQSPVQIPRGYTRRFLDGEEEGGAARLRARVAGAHARVSADADFVLAEGTGHAGVGSVVGLNNAQAAALLGLPVLVVCAGGVGRTVDEIDLAASVCNEHGARLCAAVLNRVVPEKEGDVRRYAGAGLQRRGIALCGVVPELENLHRPSVQQLVSTLRGARLVSSGRAAADAATHFADVHSLTGSADHVLKKLDSGALDGAYVVMHLSRPEVLLAVLAHASVQRLKGEDARLCVIVTSEPQYSEPLTGTLERLLRDAPFPVIVCEEGGVADTSYEIRRRIFKMRSGDRRIDVAVEHYARHIDLDALLSAAATPA